MAQSKTQQALALLRADPNRSVASVAKEIGMSQSVIRAARKVERETAHARCPHCGSKLRYLKDVFKK